MFAHQVVPVTCWFSQHKARNQRQKRDRHRQTYACSLWNVLSNIKSTKTAIKRLMLIVKFPSKTQVSPRARVGPHCRLIRQDPVHHSPESPSAFSESRYNRVQLPHVRRSHEIFMKLFKNCLSSPCGPTTQLNERARLEFSLCFNNIAKKIFHLFLLQWKLFTPRQATLSNERAASWDHSDIVCLLFIGEETFRAMFPARMLPVPAASKWPQIYSA